MRILRSPWIKAFLCDYRWYRRWFGGRWECHWIDITCSFIWLDMRPDCKWPEYRQPCSHGTPTIEDYPVNSFDERGTA